MLDLLDGGFEVHALSHVTGGGLAANLARVLPPELVVDIDRATWSPAPIFGLVQGLGRVPQDDLERTLNMGVGMVAERGLTSWVAGQVRADDGRSTHDRSRGAKGVDGGAVALVGNYR